MKKIIISADDFGLTRGINQGIIKAFREGIVKSTSIMPAGLAYDDAVRLTRENPGLDIGIHLCLTEEKPILTKRAIPSLLRKDGYFLQVEPPFLLNYYLGKIRLIEIEKELDAQIQKVKDSGIKATHIDGHDYIHMLPSILKIVIKLARKYNIPFIRYPYECPTIFRDKLPRHIIQFSLNLHCIFAKKTIGNTSCFGTEHFYGFLYSGHLSEEYLKKILKTVNNGIAEIVCHPGIYDEETKRYDHWRYEWEEELKALTSLAIKEIIRDLNIELVSFREIG